MDGWMYHYQPLSCCGGVCRVSARPALLSVCSCVCARALSFRYSQLARSRLCRVARCCGCRCCGNRCSHISIPSRSTPPPPTSLLHLLLQFTLRVLTQQSKHSSQSQCERPSASLHISVCIQSVSEGAFLCSFCVHAPVCAQKWVGAHLLNPRLRLESENPTRPRPLETWQG